MAQRVQIERWRRRASWLAPIWMLLQHTQPALAGEIFRRDIFDAAGEPLSQHFPPQLFGMFSIRARDDICNAIFPGRYSQNCSPSNTLCCVMPRTSLPQCVSVLGEGFCCTSSDTCYMDGPSVCGQEGATSCGEGTNACCPSFTTCLPGFKQTSSQVRCLLNPLFVPSIASSSLDSVLSTISTLTTVTDPRGATITEAAQVAPTGRGLVTQTGTVVMSTYIEGTTVFSRVQSASATTIIAPLTVANVYVPLTDDTLINPNKGTQTVLPTGPTVGIAVGSVVIFSIIVFVGWRLARVPRDPGDTPFHKPRRGFSMLSNLSKRTKSDVGQPRKEGSPPPMPPMKEWGGMSSDLGSARSGMSNHEMGHVENGDPYYQRDVSPMSPHGRWPSPRLPSLPPGGKY